MIKITTGIHSLCGWIPVIRRDHAIKSSSEKAGEDPALQEGRLVDIL